MPQSNFPSAVFLQFAKWPEAGRVKPRLMPELGAVGALDAHIRLTLAVLDNLCATGYPVEFWWDRPADDRPGGAESIVAELAGQDARGADAPRPQSVTWGLRTGPDCWQ